MSRWPPWLRHMQARLPAASLGQGREYAQSKEVLLTKLNLSQRETATWGGLAGLVGRSVGAPGISAPCPEWLKILEVRFESRVREPEGP